MDKSILVIGNGDWGKKLKILFNSWGFNVNQCGARSFLAHNFETKQFVLNSHIIWIASTPDLQIKIMSEILKRWQSDILILEKPFFRDLYEKSQFFQIIKENNLNVRASSPWVYSDIWSKSKGKLLELSGPLHMKIKRSGPSKTKSIISYLDWLSHDVQLISDLYNSKSMIVDIKSRGENLRPDFKEFKIRLSDGSKIEMSGGLGNSKISSWEVEDGSGTVIRINFNSKIFQYFGSDKILLETYKSPKDDNPLLNMVLNYVEQSDLKNVESYFRWQEVLIL